MAHKPDIVVLVLDSLRADRCSCYGYLKETTPALDATARQGIQYTNAYATASWTVPSIASLFTGQLPSQVGCYRGKESFEYDGETLAELFQQRGYRTVGASANPWITPTFDFDVGFDKFTEVRPPLVFPDAGDPRDTEFSDEFLAKGMGLLRWSLKGNPLKRMSNTLSYKLSFPYAEGGRVNDAVFDQLHTFPDDLFLFINYMDAHEPYLPEEQRSLLSTLETLDVTWNLGSLDDSPNVPGETVSTVYDRAVTCVDQHVESLLAFLKEQGRFEETLVVLVGDHGQALGEHGYWGHGNFLYDELLRVPLVIKPPSSWGDTPIQIDQPVSLIDIFDILSRIGEESWKSEERDHSELFSPPREGPIVAESHGKVQDLDIHSKETKLTTARRIIFPMSDITFYQSTNEAVLRTPSEEKNETVERDLEMASEINETLGALTRTEERVKTISNETKQRLADLGYR